MYNKVFWNKISLPNTSQRSWVGFQAEIVQKLLVVTHNRWQQCNTTTTARPSLIASAEYFAKNMQGCFTTLCLNIPMLSFCQTFLVNVKVACILQVTLLWKSFSSLPFSTEKERTKHVSADVIDPCKTWRSVRGISSSKDHGTTVHKWMQTWELRRRLRQCSRLTKLKNIVQNKVARETKTGAVSLLQNQSGISEIQNDPTETDNVINVNTSPIDKMTERKVPESMP